MEAQAHPCPTIEEIDSDLILSALVSMLNLEGSANRGAHKDMDVPYHCAKVREAIRVRTAELRSVFAVRVNPVEGHDGEKGSPFGPPRYPVRRPDGNVVEVGVPEKE